MSFILDALKKLEEERRRGEVPDLRAEHATPPRSRTRRKYWPALLTGALLVNALLLAWWLRPWQGERGSLSVALHSSPPVAAATATSPAETASPPVQSPPAAPVPRDPVPPALAIRSALEPAGWSDLRSDPSPPGAKSAATPAKVQPGRAAGRGKGIPHRQELPAAAAAGLPDLNISMHYYDADPGSRLIRLNGRILREGEVVAEGLQLEEITATGVILNWGGERFRTGDF